mgnify:CR=1 FL=1
MLRKDELVNISILQYDKRMMSIAFSYLVIGALAFLTIKNKKLRMSVENTKDDFVLEGSFIQ